MPYKVCRVFRGGYEPDYSKLQEHGYLILPKIGWRMISINSSNQGFGKVDGHVYELGKEYPTVPVCLFRRDNRLLLWETRSKPDGSYFFRNVAVGLECFIVAFDPNNKRNALIQDKVIPYDGRK